MYNVDIMKWFKQRTRIERLKDRYTYLMRRSYETSLRDTKKSERLHQQAVNLFQEIQYLSLQQNN